VSVALTVKVRRARQLLGMREAGEIWPPASRINTDPAILSDRNGAA
jgi:hypothetical protein